MKKKYRSTRSIFDELDALNRDVRIERTPHDLDWTDRASTEPTTLKKPFISKRIFLAAIFCGIGFCLLFFRLMALQSQSARFRSTSDTNHIRIISQPAPRGIIKDRNGVVLAKNEADVGVFVVQNDLPKNEIQRNEVIAKLSSMTNVPLDELKKRINDIMDSTTIEPIPIVDSVTHDQAIMLSVKSDQLPGVFIAPKIKRVYPIGNVVSNVLGYAGKISAEEWKTLKTTPGYAINDVVGKTGVEQTYETSLKGIDGKQEIQVDAKGHIASTLASQNAKPGTDIGLSIDSDLQTVLYNSIVTHAKDAKATGGAAVALDPRNGEVLAIVTWPTYDNNLFSGIIDSKTYAALISNPNKPLFDRPVSGEYPSGSTIKPLMAAAALAEHLITSKTTVVSTGGIKINQWFFPDWKAGGHGVTDVYKAIAESVNTFFYTIGGGYGNIQGLGVDRIKKYGELFGLNKKLGIDLPGESSGFLPTEDWKKKTQGESWYIGDTYHLAIGQGYLLVTPLQIANYISAISNGGTLYRPHVVKEINGQEVPPQVIGTNLIDNSVLSIVRQGMRQTVLSGSGRSFQNISVSVSAKTGTAEFGTGKNYHAWFTSFAPSDNPQIEITTFLEGGGEGGTFAAPIAHDALDWWTKNRYKK